MADNSFDSSYSDSDNSKIDSELNTLLDIEKQKAEFTAQIHGFNDICWDKCVDKPGSKLGSRTETCISNCVDRFIDKCTNQNAVFPSSTKTSTVCRWLK